MATLSFLTTDKTRKLNRSGGSETEPLVLDREDAQPFLEALSQPVVFNDAMTKALKAHGEVVQSE